MLSPAEIAARLRISRRTVNRLISTGAITATRVGGQWRVEPAALEAYVKAQTTGTHERTHS